MSAISFASVGVEFGATRIFADVTFVVGDGDRWGVIGRNGTGKTSLFRLLTGELQQTSGSIARRPGLRVSLLEQHRRFGDAETVWEGAAGGVGELLALEKSLVAQAAALASDSSAAAMERYSRDLERFEREGGYEVTSRIDSVLQGLGFDPVAARTTPVSVLSGGERGRLALARQLAEGADILLLDEPTNHLDLETTRWLEEYLAGSEKTVIVVSHDRAFLSAVTDHTLHFEGGSAVPYSAGYQEFLAIRAERRLTQQRAFDREKRFVEHERDYIARNIAGQNSKQAKGRRKRLERMARLTPPVEDEASMALRFEVRERGGDIVAEARAATIAVDDRVLVKGFTGVLRRTDILGLIGSNGSGKSTLIRTLLGEHPLQSGTFRTGASIQVGYYRQDLSQVPLDRTIYATIEALRPHWERRLIQGHLGRFGFSGDEVQRRNATLSGGELSRVALAMLMLSGANLLILDEPTNHLDVESIEALEDAIDAYDGTVILVSHDRELLRALTTRLWIVHEQRVTEFDGGFAEWEELTRERERAAAVRSAEEAALRKVQERRKVRSGVQGEGGSTGSTARSQLRIAEKELAQVEGRIELLESRVSELITRLEDPVLYTGTASPDEAHRLGLELTSAKSALDDALAEWETLSSRISELTAAQTEVR